MINEIHLKILEKLIIEEEGMRFTKYKCSKGIDTIGIGWASTFGMPPAIQNITGKNKFEDVDELTEKQAVEILDYMLRYFESQISNRFDWYKYKSQATKIAIVNIVFNIGLSSFSKFHGTISALEIDDLETASLEILDSSYFNDVKGRALRTSLIVLSQNPLITNKFTDNLYKVIKKRLV